MYKKYLLPLIYPLFLLPVFFGTIFAIQTSEDLYGFIFPGTGEMEAELSILVLGLVFFIGASALMSKLERLERPKIADHFRQSSLFYLLFIIGLIHAAKGYPTERGGLGYGLLLIVVATCLWAIVVNALYLLFKSRNIVAVKNIGSFVTKYRFSIFLIVVAMLIAGAVYVRKAYDYRDRTSLYQLPVFKDENLPIK